MPERQDLEARRRLCHAIVQIVSNSGEMQPTDPAQRQVSSASAELGLYREERRGAFDLLANRVWSLGPMDRPPCFSRANLADGEGADDNGRESLTPGDAGR